MQRPGLLLIALWGGFNSACTPSSPADGQRVFAQRCAACHTVEKLAPGMRKQADGTAYLQRFLEQHHPPPATERAAVIDYLVRQAGK